MARPYGVHIKMVNRHADAVPWCGAVCVCVDLMEQQFWEVSSLVMIESVPRKSLNGPPRAHLLHFHTVESVDDDDGGSIACPKELLTIILSIITDFDRLFDYYSWRARDLFFWISLLKCVWSDGFVAAVANDTHSGSANYLFFSPNGTQHVFIWSNFIRFG